MYYTHISNIFCKELARRPLGLSVLKILLHEHFLDDSIFYIIFGISNEPNDVLGCGLLFDQKRVGLLLGRHL